jgi:hypothetical protein
LHAERELTDVPRHHSSQADITTTKDQDAGGPGAHGNAAVRDLHIQEVQRANRINGGALIVEEPRSLDGDRPRRPGYAEPDSADPVRPRHDEVREHPEGACSISWVRYTPSALGVGDHGAT